MDAEAETLGSALGQIDFLDAEIEQAERTVAKQVLSWPEARRLLTVPGVNVIAAASFLAAVGDIHRLRDSRKPIAYHGLDPESRQSGDQPARLRPDLKARLELGAVGAGPGRLVSRATARAAARVL